MQCDVVVVGAGPGGSTAAYWLARAGADVLLVDKARFPRGKPCGDGLAPRAIDQLKALGLPDAVLAKGRPFVGVRALPQGRSSFLVCLAATDDGESRRGLVLPRADLDDALRRRAISVGARFLDGFVARSPCHHRGRLAGLQGHHGQRSVTIRTQLMVIATGANRALLRSMDLVDKDQPSGLAMRAYADGLEDLDDYLEIYLDRETLPGYAWIFPMGDGTANVGVGTKLDGVTPAEGSRQLQAAFGRFLRRDRMIGARLLGRPQGSAIRTDFPAVPTSAPGVLVVGEAAGLVNPLTGEGVALALESGRLAAEVASKALISGDFSDIQLRAYGDALREKHTSLFARGHELLGRLAHPEVLDAIIEASGTDSRVREALTIAIVDEHPGNGIALLKEVLHSDDGCSLARSLFTMSAYHPLLDRCRVYMLAQVGLDTPSPFVLDLLGRGKMLRALLVFLGCQAAGGDPEQVLAGAAGIELVHAASLIHDDIMDNAETRRGLPALHRTLGLSQATVCGDYLIAKAFRLLAESRATSPAARVVEAFIIGAESGIRTCRGQFQDVGDWESEVPSEKAYDQLIAGKTAAAIAGALMAGAVLAGAGPSLLKALSCYGECVGRAFQVRDDLLDFERVPGSACSVDRRLTLPLIHALEHSDDQGRGLVRRFLDRQEVPDSEMTRLLRATGSLSYAREIADSLMRQATRLAKAIPQIDGELEAFARYTVMRDY